MKLAGRWQPYLLAALACLGLAVLTAIDIYRERQLAIGGARESTANLANLLEQHTRQVLRRVEVHLDEVHRWLTPSTSAIPGPELRQRVQELLAGQTLIHGVEFFDAQGALRLSTHEHGSELAGDVTQREWFLRHHQANAAKLALGRMESTVDGKRLLPVSRRINTAEGSFAGVLLVLVDLAPVQAAFDAVDTGRSGFVTLFLEQGWLVATAPPNAALFDRDWSDTPLFKQHLTKARRDTVQQVVVRDSTERVYSYRALADFPVVVSMGISLTDALQDWRTRLWWNSALLVTISAALLLFAAALSRHVVRRETAERVLGETAAQTRAIVEHAADGIVTFDAMGHIETVNLAGAALWGQSPQTLMAQNLTHWLPALRLPATPAQEGRSDGQARRADGSLFPVEMSLTRSERQSAPVYIALLRDITEAQRAQMQLAQERERTERSEAFLRAVTDSLPLRIGYVDTELRFRFVNQAYCQDFGLPREQLLGRTRQELTHEAAKPEVLTELALVLAGQARRFEFEEVLAGQRRVIECHAVPDKQGDGSVHGIYLASGDVTERHEQQRQLQLALAERETLLREVYHRVKNNLQLVQSMLNLQRRALPEGAARTALDESMQRVRAMALVHEKLYQTGTLSALGLGEYTQDLLQQLDLATGAAQRGIVLQADVQALQAPLELAVPYGLLVVELVSNSLKHGFPDGRQGEVRVQLTRQDQGIELRVADTGVGLPPSFVLQSVASMGLQLAAALATQLGGQLSACNEGGAVFVTPLPKLS